MKPFPPPVFAVGSQSNSTLVKGEEEEDSPPSFLPVTPPLPINQKCTISRQGFFPFHVGGRKKCKRVENRTKKGKETLSLCGKGSVGGLIKGKPSPLFKRKERMPLMLLFRYFARQMCKTIFSIQKWVKKIDNHESQFSDLFLLANLFF